MSKKDTKSAVVAIKVEEELARFLDQLPNKSEFIRRAIYSQLGVSCPLCTGTGRVSRETHDHFAAFLSHFELHSCEGCGSEFPIPKDSDAVDSDHPLPQPLRQHLSSVLEKGREYCFTCFVSTSDAK